MRSVHRARLALPFAALLAAGCAGPGGWVQTIAWRPLVSCGRVMPVSGRSDPRAKPPRIEIACAMRARAMAGK